MAEDPDFVEEMVSFWADFVSQAMAPVLERVALDSVGMSEDMAYKEHSMISPAMTRRFLLPAYERWCAEIKASGCPIIDMDSDGHIGELIPIWIEAGINCCDPIEAAAGNDVIEYRNRFGHNMAYKGAERRRLHSRLRPRRAPRHLLAQLRRVRPPVGPADGMAVTKSSRFVPAGRPKPSIAHRWNNTKPVVVSESEAVSLSLKVSGRASAHSRPPIRGRTNCCNHPPAL